MANAHELQVGRELLRLAAERIEQARAAKDAEGVRVAKQTHERVRRSLERLLKGVAA